MVHICTALFCLLETEWPCWLWETAYVSKSSLDIDDNNTFWHGQRICNTSLEVGEDELKYVCESTRRHRAAGLKKKD